MLDEDGDLAVKDGDFFTGPSLHQEVDLTLKSNPGDWKINRLFGPALIRMMRAAFSADAILRVIKLHLKSDGKTARGMKYEDGHVIIKEVDQE